MTFLLGWLVFSCFQFLLLGAVPFPTDVPRLKGLGVQGVITLNESYETLVPTSLYHVSIASFESVFLFHLRCIGLWWTYLNNKFRYHLKLCIGNPSGWYEMDHINNTAEVLFWAFFGSLIIENHEIFDSKLFLINSKDILVCRYLHSVYISFSLHS